VLPCPICISSLIWSTQKYLVKSTNRMRIMNCILLPVSLFPLFFKSKYSPQYHWATGWTIGVLGFDFRRGLGIFLYTTASRTALGPTQPRIQWVSGALSLGVKRPGREADHSPPSSAEVKECVELYLHSPNTSSWRGAHLKHMDNFTIWPYFQTARDQLSHPYITTHKIMVLYILIHGFRHVKGT
jgi:hypothetical protein